MTITREAMNELDQVMGDILPTLSISNGRFDEILGANETEFSLRQYSELMGIIYTLNKAQEALESFQARFAGAYEDSLGEEDPEPETAEATSAPEVPVNR